MSKWTSKQRDIILAGAIGDAVGYLIEFSKLSAIHGAYGTEGLRIENIHKDYEFVVSDDTQMTLFAMEAIASSYKIDKNNIYDSYYQWYLTQHANKKELATSRLAKFESMCHPRAPGVTCLSSLSSGKNDAENDSKGCGAVMRAAPFGFYKDAEECMNSSYIQSIVTHQHKCGYMSSIIMSLLMYIALNTEMTLPEAVERAMLEVELYYGDTAKETADILNLALKLYNSNPTFNIRSLQMIGEGWVGEEALAIAAYAALCRRTFEDCIAFSINHSGDSDSTGSIAAQIWVAFNGLPEQYKDWDKRLDISDAFEYVMSLE